MGCPELPLDAAAAFAACHGLAGIELRSLGGTIDLPAHFAANFGTPAALARRWRDNAGTAAPVVALCPSLKLVGATAEDRAAFLQVVPWAEALGARWLRVFDGRAATEPGAAAATVRWWREERARQAWQADIMVETHDSLLTAATIARFLDRCPGTAIRWDSHHTWKKGGEEPLLTWRSVAGAVVSIDVKDSISRPSARHPYTYVLPGDGEFPMAPLREALAADYAGPLCLEWEKLWHPDLPSLEAALHHACERGWW